MNEIHREHRIESGGSGQQAFSRDRELLQSRALARGVDEPVKANGRRRSRRRHGAIPRWALLLTALLVTALLAAGLPLRASADSITVIGNTYPPADLLNEAQLSSATSLYAATSDQEASLHSLEQQAVANTIHDHGLPASDAAAVQTWARPDAEAELWALVVQAIKTSSCTSGQTPGQGCRTTDQQNAVDWLSGMFKAQAVQAAQDAGLEYVKWAGLDQSTYQLRLNANASESDLSSFLSGPVLNFPGYCTYHSPAPYADEYTGRDDQTCFTPCTNLLGCTPPTPTYDQFVKWGEADVNNALFNSADYAASARSMAVGLSLSAAVVASAVTGVALSSALSSVLISSALQVALFPYMALPWGTGGALTVGEAAALGGSVTAGAVAFVVSVVILAVVAAVLQGLSVFDAAALPGKIAHLIAETRTSTVDLNAALNDSNQAQGVFALFVGATMPTPTTTTCAPATVSGAVPCLNAPPIPAAASSDPEFAITAKDSTQTTYDTSITWEDAAQHITTNTRVSGHWFVNHLTAAADGSTATVQSLRLHYKDWNGNGNTVWLMGNDTDGYTFVGGPDLSESGSPLNPSTCVADATCFSSSTINYIGADGTKYSASVVPSKRPTVDITTSPNPTEGSPVTFSVVGSSPLNLPLTYTWAFEQIGLINCDMQTGTCDSYTGDTSGDHFSHTWQTSGTGHVRLTATDSLGKSTVTIVSVDVADVPPILTLTSPQCTFACDTRTADLGNAVTLSGAVTHAGTDDSESLHIDWGDGSTDDGSFNPSISYSSSNLQLTRPSGTLAKFSGSHTYATPGHYTATVTVTDQANATDTDTAAMTVQTTPTLHLPSPAAITYGTGLSSTQLAATVSAQGAPSVPGTFTYSVDGSPVTANQVIAAGHHTLSVAFMPTDTGVYKTPDPVSVPLTVNAATLTVTADAQQMTLHGSVPSLTYQYSGFVNGDTPSVLTTAPTCSTTASSASAVGSYPITCSSGGAANYTFTYKPATLSVLYRWSGFSKPINDPVAGSTPMSVFKAGSTVSAKFQLKDAKGVIVQAGSLPTFSVSPLQACTVSSVNQAVSTGSASTGTTYRWDSTAKQYVYSYRAPSTAAGTCQYVQATLDDGTTQMVLVGFH